MYGLKTSVRKQIRLSSNFFRLIDIFRKNLGIHMKNNSTVKVLRADGKIVSAKTPIAVTNALVVQEQNLRAIGKRLSHIRTSLGETQAEIADSIGVSLRTWQNYEQSRSPPDAATLTALYYLGFSPIWILTGKEKAEVPQGLNASHAVDGKTLMVAYELAEEALRGGGWLPKHQFFDLVGLLYARLSEQRPYTELIEFARAKAAKLGNERANGDDKQEASEAGSNSTD